MIFFGFDYIKLNISVCFIQIVPQVAAMSDRADKMKMISKLSTSSGNRIFFSKKKYLTKKKFF
jgi:hypothetical protein